MLAHSRGVSGIEPLYVPSSAQVREFQRRGFVHLRNIIPPRYLEVLVEFREATLRRLDGRRNLVPFFHGSQVYDSELSRALFYKSPAAAVGSALLRMPRCLGRSCSPETEIPSSFAHLRNTTHIWSGGPPVRYVYDALLLDWSDRKVHEPPNGFGRFHADRESRLGPDENLVTIFWRDDNTTKTVGRRFSALS